MLTLGCLLVATTQHELQLVGRDANRLEESPDNLFVEFGARVDKLERGFKVVEETVDSGQQDRNVAAGLEELGNLDRRGQVAGIGRQFISSFNLSLGKHTQCAAAR